MKATGIVRRIDDLGRVVVPKEIRRTMRIKEGDPLEIFTNDGEIILKKYSSLIEIQTYANIYVDILHKFIKYPILVTDKDLVVYTIGVNKREYIERRVSTTTEDIIKNRTFVFSENKDDDNIIAIEGIQTKVKGIVSISSLNDNIGSLIILDNPNLNNIKLDKDLVLITAEYLGKQISE